MSHPESAPAAAHPAPNAAPARTLCLARCGARDAGAALCLRKGDTLAGVDNAPWRGTAEALQARLAAADRPLALTFRRGGVALTVLAQRADLGLWESVAAEATAPPLPQDPARLCNWEVMVHADGSHDLIALRPSLLALVAPPLWLAQARLWTLFATLGAGMAIALPAGALLVAGVWVAAGLHLWRAGDKHLRAARMAEGYRKVGVIAGTTEGAARAAWATLEPGARFRYSAEAADSGTAGPHAAAI
jgi:hypothetical protein